MLLLQLRVSGMSCGSCSVAIQNALDRIPGITHASVGLLSNTAEVTHASNYLKMNLASSTLKACPIFGTALNRLHTCR